MLAAQFPGRGSWSPFNAEGKTLKDHHQHTQNQFRLAVRIGLHEYAFQVGSRSVCANEEFLGCDFDRLALHQFRR
jgi:hypothetical protein